MALAALASGDLKHWYVSGFAHCMVGSRGAATDWPAVFAATATGTGKTAHHCRAAGIYGRHAVAASGSQPDAHFAGATRGGVDRYSGRDRHGAKPDGARHSGSDNRALSSGAAAGLFAADGDLVWYWRNLEDLADLFSDFAPVAMSALAG